MIRTVSKLEAAKQAGTMPPLRSAPQINRTTFPLRVTTQ